MIRRFIAASAFLVVSAYAAADIPRVLVVQLGSHEEGTMQLANLIAQEIDDNGKLSSVVWGLTDPVFREAATAEKLGQWPEDPKQADAVSAAKALNADYVFLVQTNGTKIGTRGAGQLLKGGKVIWKDDVILKVAGSGSVNDQISTARSIAHTLVIKMDAAVLKGMTPKAAAPTPAPARGQEPVPVAPVAPPPAKSDNSKLRENVKELLGSNHYASALLAVRDAVDAEPFDIERRSMLIDLLRQTDPQASADEALRVGDLLPDKPEFRILAARAYLRSGRLQEAQEALNEAIARAPDLPETRVLLAQLALQQNDPERALTHLDQALKPGPNADVFALRALCRAILGGVDGMKQDLAAAEKASADPSASSPDVATRYAVAMQVMDQRLSADIDSVKALVQRAIVRASDPEVKSKMEETQRLLASRIAYMEAVPHPADQQKSLDRRILANKLLAQSLRDLTAYMGGNADALTDCRMNLGEAVKQLAAVKSEIQ